MYLKSRGIVPEHFYDQRNNQLARVFQDSGLNKVDILRLSHNVRRNIIKEEEEDNNKYSSGTANNANEIINISKNSANGQGMAIVGAAA